MPPEGAEDAVISRISFDKPIGPAGTRALCAGLLVRPFFPPYSPFLLLLVLFRLFRFIALTRQNASLLTFSSSLFNVSHPFLVLNFVQARGMGMEPAPYKPLKSLRLWKCDLQDAGTGHVAELVRTGPVVDVGLAELELIDDGIGPVGCYALGDALMLGANTTLTSLRLDFNPTIGDEGVRELARGLRTNRTLQQLTLSYCGITAAGAPALAEIIESPISGLVSLDLRGNALGSEGLTIIATAARRSKKLEELVLADNGIGAADSSTNQAGLEALGMALAEPAEMTGLCKVDLQMNVVSEEDMAVLIPFLGPENKKVKSFLVDSSLPGALFDALNRVDTSSGKKKKGGKKKKKAG